MVFDQPYTQIMFEASRSPKATTLKERPENQSAMFLDENVSQIVVGD